LATLTPDIGKILNAMHGVELKGNVQFVRALDIAQVSFFVAMFFVRQM
jgi:hypothetical protein